MKTLTSSSFSLQGTLLSALILCFALFPFGSFAQQSDTVSYTLKYFNKTEFGVSFGFGSYQGDVYSGTNGGTKTLKNTEIVATLQTVNGIMYNRRWMLGASVGVEKWQNGLFWPVYGYLGYNFKRADNTFFANIYLGYGFGTRYASDPNYNQGSGAFAMMIGVGYRMKVTKVLKFGYEIFYKLQTVKSTYDLYRYDSIGPNNHEWRQYATTDYKFNMNFAGFKVTMFLP
jgi:hypothetical protein